MWVCKRWIKISVRTGSLIVCLRGNFTGIFIWRAFYWIYKYFHIEWRVSYNNYWRTLYYNNWRTPHHIFRGAPHRTSWHIHQWRAWNNLFFILGCEIIRNSRWSSSCLWEISDEIKLSSTLIVSCNIKCLISLRISWWWWWNCSRWFIRCLRISQLT